MQTASPPGPNPPPAPTGPSGPAAARDRLEAGVYQAIVEQMPDAVVFADPGGVIRIWNAGAEAVFGFSRAEALGSGLDLIIPERFRRAHWEAFDQAIARGHTRLGSQVRTTRSLHKDGRKLYVDLSFGLVSGGSGAVIGATAVGRDCSARYLADRALRERVAALEGPAAGS